jgi:hypothetical protein
MTRRGWGRSVLIAIAAAAAAAAAQAGLGYGLVVVAWAPIGGGNDTVTDSGAWSANLAWTALIAATSVVIGAVAGERDSAAVPLGPALRGLRRILLCLAASIGGAAAIALTAIPAQFARVPGQFAPHLLVGVYAAVGLVAGLVVALLATTMRAVAANVFATMGWLWALAVIVVVHRSVTGHSLAYVAPAVWKFTQNGPILASFYLPGALLMLGSALLIGGLAAFPAAGRGAGRFGIAISGGIGPLLVAGAYLLADPDPDKTPFEQMSAFHIAPYVAVAGLVGSVLVAIVGGVPARRKPPRSKKKPASVPQQAQEPPNTSYSATASVPASSRIDPGWSGS